METTMTQNTSSRWWVQFSGLTTGEQLMETGLQMSIQ